MTPDRPVYRVLLRSRIDSERTDEFESAWGEVADAISAEPANLNQWLMRAQDDPNYYYIITDWTDEASFRRFELSPGHVEHRARLAKYRSENSMTSMHVVRGVEKKGPTPR